MQEIDLDDNEEESKKHMDAVNCPETSSLLPSALKKSKTPAERMREYRLRRKHKILNDVEQEKRRESLKRKNQNQKKIRDQKRIIKKNKNIDKPAKKSRADYQREYRLKKKNINVDLNSDLAEVIPRQEAGSSSYLAPSTTAQSTQIAVATPAVVAKLASASLQSPPLPSPTRTLPIRNNRRQASPRSATTPPRQSLLKARRYKRTTPSERTADEFADVEKCRLQYEEERDKRLHEREMERLRLDAARTEVAREHNLLLHQLTDIGERLIDVLSKTLGPVGNSPSPDPLLTQVRLVSVKGESDF